MEASRLCLQVREGFVWPEIIIEKMVWEIFLSSCSSVFISESQIDQLVFYLYTVARFFPE